MGVTTEQVLAALERLVKGREDFVYQEPLDGEGCRYVWNGQPSCGVAQVAVAEGWATVEELARLEGCGPDAVLGWTWDGVCGVSPASVLTRFQVAQDGEHPWGEALEYARDPDYVLKPQPAI